MAHDRRRYPRSTVGVAVTLEAGSRQWQAKTLNLSPYGVKVASPDPSHILQPGSNVQLRMALPDQDAPLALPASVARTDPDGVALKFGSLGDAEFGRVKTLVASLLQQEWQTVLHEIGGVPAGPAPMAFRPPQGSDTRAPRPRAWGGRATGAPAPMSPEPGPRTEAAESSVAITESETDRWQALLNRRGLGTLQLPREGTLSRPWRELLARLEAEESEGRQ